MKIKIIIRWEKVFTMRIGGLNRGILLDVSGV